MNTLILSNLIVSGLGTGAIYAIIALGIVFIFKTMDAINFAEGDIGMFMTFIAFSLMYLKIPYPIVFIIVVALSFLFGVLIEKGILHFIKGMSPTAIIIATLGLVMILQGMAGFIWGTDTKPFPSLWKGPPFKAYGMVFGRQDIITLITALVIFIVLVFILKKTKIGVAIRAVSEDEYAALLTGVRVSVIFSFVWGFSGLLAGLGGMLAAPRFSLDTNMMTTIQLKAFTAAVLGGFSSIPGAVFGGLILGVLENLISFYISSSLKEPISLIIIVIVLLISPSGLFGKRIKKRV
ncbi:MAG: branched-chain amino acid ABC transporter permease [Nitrospiraceae bacterium]|nr:branched-chain amino acid ABC transporter permease [Nitrospiraceae bacterium]